MVECQLPKLKVAGSNPVSRSKKIKGLADTVKPFFCLVSAFVPVWQKSNDLYSSPNSGHPTVLLEQSPNAALDLLTVLQPSFLRLLYHLGKAGLG